MLELWRTLYPFTMGTFFLRQPNYIKTNLSNHIRSELLALWNIKYNLPSQTYFSLSAIYTTNYGLRYLKHFTPKIWNIVKNDANNLWDFALNIKSWIPGGRPCNLCRIYLCQRGYINWLMIRTNICNAFCLLICWWFKSRFIADLRKANIF